MLRRAVCQQSAPGTDTCTPLLNAAAIVLSQVQCLGLLAMKKLLSAACLFSSWRYGRPTGLSAKCLVAPQQASRTRLLLLSPDGLLASCLHQLAKADNAFWQVGLNDVTQVRLRDVNEPLGSSVFVTRPGLPTHTRCGTCRHVIVLFCRHLAFCSYEIVLVTRQQESGRLATQEC